jgi:hypothetical protein
MGNAIKIMQDNYMSTLGRSFVVNVTTMQHIFYKIIEVFMDPEVKQKITIHKELNPKALTDLFHPS